MGSVTGFGPILIAAGVILVVIGLVGMLLKKRKK